jgi:hypothetical protein
MGYTSTTSRTRTVKHQAELDRGHKPLLPAPFRVAAFRSRSLDGAPYTYVWLDALSMRVREGGRIAQLAVPWWRQG